MKRRNHAKSSSLHKNKNALLVTLVVFAVVLAGAAGWTRWVYWQIEFYAGDDQAAPSDAIAVLGAA